MVHSYHTKSTICNTRIFSSCIFLKHGYSAFETSVSKTETDVARHPTFHLLAALNFCSPTSRNPHLFRSLDMRYHLAPLFCRPWTLNAISPRLIESHYENNYGGALNRLNAITEELGSLDPATTPADVLSRLKRDETAALNSTLLHELYFASLGGDRRPVPNAMADAIIRDFGSAA